MKLKLTLALMVFTPTIVIAQIKVIETVPVVKLGSIHTTIPTWLEVRIAQQERHKKDLVEAPIKKIVRIPNIALVKPAWAESADKTNTRFRR
jgi:hypothetical protein